MTSLTKGFGFEISNYINNGELTDGEEYKIEGYLAYRDLSSKKPKIIPLNTFVITLNHTMNILSLGFPDPKQFTTCISKLVFVCVKLSKNSSSSSKKYFLCYELAYKNNKYNTLMLDILDDFTYFKNINIKVVDAMTKKQRFIASKALGQQAKKKEAADHAAELQNLKTKISDLEQDKTDLKNANQQLIQDKTALEQEKAKLEQEKNLI